MLYMFKIQQMWVDRGTILVAKAFSLVVPSAFRNQCTFKVQGKPLSSPSGKRVWPSSLPITPHHCAV